MNAPEPIRRVLLALDAVAHDPDAFEAASTLAARLGAELEALFVEDADLARLAALPFAHELGLSSGTRRPLQHGDVERAWRTEALRARRALSVSAARHQVRWSFRVLRAPAGAMLAQSVVQSDLLAVTLGPAAGTTGLHRLLVRGVLQRPPCPLLVRPAGMAMRAPYVVLFEQAGSGARALRLAAQLAGPGAGEVEVLIAAADPARREQLRAAAEEIATQARMSIATRVLAAVGPTVAAALIKARRPGTLVLAADSALVDSASLQRLAAAGGWVGVLAG